MGDHAFETGLTAESAPSGPALVRPLSVWDRLKAQKVANDEAVARRVSLCHPEVPALRGTFRLPANGEEIAKVYKRAGTKAGQSGAEGIHAARLILATFCEELFVDGEQLVDEDGLACSFSHPKVWAVFEVASAADAVAAAYGSDAFVTALAERLLDEAGFNGRSEVEVSDPTKAR